tara:strand:- start:250 stop:381 length:132 start_codon:yes stop_codon:yes gene_type:complete
MVRKDEMNLATISKYGITISKYGTVLGMQSLQVFSFQMIPATD